jgi:hypothetical protein
MHTLHSACAQACVHWLWYLDGEGCCLDVSIDLTYHDGDALKDDVVATFQW